MRSLWASRTSRPSGIAKPSQIASVSGVTIASTTTSRRSRGEMRSQKSRALSVIVDMATSHALRGDRQAKLLGAVLAGVGVAALDFFEALDLLELGDQQIDLFRRLRRAFEIDLLIVDIELVDIDRHLVLGRDVRVDLDQHVVRGHLRQRRD